MQEQLRIEVSNLLAQINKEKARLAITKMDYRIKNYRRSKSLDRAELIPRRSTTFELGEEFRKVDCVNEDLVEKLKKHLSKYYKLGECTIKRK